MPAVSLAARSAKPPAGAPRASLQPSWYTQAALILGKDLRVEFRTGEVLTTSAFFGLLVVVIGSMAFYTGPSTQAVVAAGVIWLSVAFSAVLALGRGWQREREEGALEGLLAAPVARSAIFAGKTVGLGIFLGVIELVVVPVAALLFLVDLAEVGAGLVVLLLLATPAVAASGTLFGSMTARTRARELLLSVVLFPLIAPVLITAVVATRELFGGAPFGELTDYLKLLGLFDLLFVGCGLALFGTLLEG
jgi:heme exporter protein B